MKLATKRLVLRPFTVKDIPEVHVYSSKTSVTKYMTWGPNTQKDSASFVHDVILKGKENPRYNYDFIVTLKDGIVIGACGIYFTALDKAPSLGWIFDEPYWQQGYGTEVAAALLSFAFKRLKVKSVRATADSENIASYKIMERIGMRFAGETPKEYQKIGKRIERKYELSALEYRLLNHKTFI